MQTSQSKFSNGAFGSGVFIENHDQPRFPSFTKDMAVSQLARKSLPFAHVCPARQECYRLDVLD